MWLLKHVWRWTKRLAAGIAALVLFYLGFLLIGLIPINRDFEHTEGGVVIYLMSSSIHADIIVPINNATFGWRELFPSSDFSEDTAWATHMAIGWGDRGFYLETPTWDDLKASAALKALLLPSESVVHVACTTSPEHFTNVRRVQLSNEQYDLLCQSIQQSLQTNEQAAAKLIVGRAYGNFDAFYEASGSYNCFYTCNSWIGGRLSDAGVSTPLFTPLPGMPMLYLDEQSTD